MQCLSHFYMNLTLYKNLSEKNKIGKDLHNNLSLNGNLREESSIINPTILVEHSNLAGYNYAYIPEFNRYYFITEITSVRNNLWRISLKVDVLESFKTDILNLNCIVDKQQNQSYSNNIDDGSYINKADSFIEIANYQNGFNSSGEFILITAGAI